MTERTPLTPDDETRRRRFIKYLKRHDLSCAQVAEMLGVAHVTTRMWKCGMRRINKRYLRQLMDAKVGEGV